MSRKDGVTKRIKTNFTLYYRYLKKLWLIFIELSMPKYCTLMWLMLLDSSEELLSPSFIIHIALQFRIFKTVNSRKNLKKLLKDINATAAGQLWMKILMPMDVLWCYFSVTIRCFSSVSQSYLWRSLLFCDSPSKWLNCGREATVRKTDIKFDTKKITIFFVVLCMN